MTLLALQVTACVLSLVSGWLCGRKSLWGPAISVIDTVPWGIIALLTHTPVVFCFDLLMGGLALRTLVLWRMHETQRGCPHH